MDDLFWPVFAAVLDAGLLLVAFVWACFHMDRREMRQESNGLYIATAMMVFAFAALSSYIAFGGH